MRFKTRKGELKMFLKSQTKLIRIRSTITKQYEIVCFMYKGNHMILIIGCVFPSCTALEDD